MIVDCHHVACVVTEKNLYFIFFFFFKIGIFFTELGKKSPNFHCGGPEFPHLRTPKQILGVSPDHQLEKLIFKLFHLQR